jgi:glyoxylase-like metal-dependent hydrolase (beta-lactamase superfamily II)
MVNRIEITRVEDDLYQVLLNFVHVFLIDDPEDGLILIDSGYPSQDGNPLLEAVEQMGRTPKDVRNVVITQAHPDHIGNVGELQEAGEATIWMSAIDAPILEGDQVFRPFKTVDARPPTTPPPIKYATVQWQLQDGDVVPLAGGIEAIATPGHSLGHLALLWRRHGGVLFMGDLTTNVSGHMALQPNYENLGDERRSVRKLLGRSFEKIAFAHGTYIARNGAQRFHERWA